MGKLSWQSWEGKEMKIGFIGNYQSGYVGEVSDETHITRELEALGHEVYKIPRDEWREHVLSAMPYPNVPDNLKLDICIFTKWHHFGEGFIKTAKQKYQCPVWLWCWDYMQNEDWHLKMIEECDLYLGNDVRNGLYKEKAYYFPFDVADGSLPYHQPQIKKHDVVFFGSWIGQGDRQSWLTALSTYIPIKVFSWNYQDWPVGFDASPAVYGEEFNKAVAQGKIVLGFSVNPSTWGYWSNRVGKTLLAGGFLLYQYAPGMELFLRDGVEYFSTIDEAKEKIDYYLMADTERERIAKIGYMIGQERFSSKARIKDLCILIERYLIDHGNWSY